MATKINPPDLSSGNYELYKEKLLAWQMVTDIPVDKQGIVIALTLPNDDKHKIQEEVFSQIGREKLSQENGLDTLINFLDSKLMKDDLSDSLEKFEEFEDFQRVNGQNITEYIAAFDSRYRKMEKFKIKLPSEILAFKLLRRANISKEEKMLVLTGMNYANRETLYEEAKQSLKKFKGDITEGSISTAASVKLEPAFLAENEEALLAAGYYKQGQGKRSVRTGRGGYSRGGGQRGQGQEARRKMNPTGPDGKPLTCRVCGSYRHLMKDCPDSWENIKKVNIVEDENVVLFTGYNKEEIYQLGVDARNCAILDSACSSTVCGQNWMDSYINSLNEVDRKKIKQTTGERTFKFGGGTRLKSRAEYCLPAVIAGKEVTIKTDVVGSDIPLLLSRTAMKRAGVKMDLENDSATIFGKDIALNRTTSGHYCIPIDRTENIAVEEVFSVKLEEMGRQDKVKTLLKLHRQFAHPRPRKLKSLLQDADIWRDDYQDLLEEIDRKCELCKRYSKTPARPVVGMPMATQFNEKVAMDLKQWKGRWILHIIDMWSRYTISVFINRKRPSEVINALMQNWVGVFGVMGSILTDNGGEFNADEMREVMSILNVRVLTTAAESPFQNGLCERVHAVTDMMLLKLEEENKRTDSQTLLCWANMARNALQMWNGYSSHQLIFGKNPNLPGIMTDGLPGLEGSTSSEIFAKHLNALHSSRRAYIETEANERIRRALRGKIRAAEDIFEKGDTVYYKREGKERWLGPATVVFQEGKVVFVRHGGIFVRVSPNRIERVNEILERHESGDAVQTEHKEGVVETNEEETEEESPVSEVIAAPVPAEDQNYEAPDRNSENQLSVTDQELQTVSSETATGSVENDRDTDRNTERSTRVKVNDNIRYKLGDEWVNGTIISRAGKASGKYKNWYNVRNENNDERSIDLERHEWQKIPETEIKEFRYIGFKVKQYENRVILDHSEYIERMKNETVDPKRATDKKEILTTQEQKLYRQLVGQLNWAVQGSRPDMAFEMINMSTKLKQGTVENLVRVIKKISRMKDFHSYMTFPRLNKAAELKIVVFTDASLGNINEGTGSTGAYIVWLMDNTGQCCPIAWNAHKIKRVVRSTLAAETLGLEEGLEASYYYREMLASILGVKPRTVMIEAYVDNKSIIEAILSTRLVEDKRLRVDVAAIKESLQLHDVKKIQWVPGHLQLANPMTKQGASGFNLLKVLQSGKMLDELC